VVSPFTSLFVFRFHVFIRFYFQFFLEEETAHTPAHALTVVENVEFVDKLVQVVAGLRNRRQIRLQQHVVVLRVVFLLEQL